MVSSSRDDIRRDGCQRDRRFLDDDIRRRQVVAPIVGRSTTISARRARDDRRRLDAGSSIGADDIGVASNVPAAPSSERDRFDRRTATTSAWTSAAQRLVGVHHVAERIIDNRRRHRRSDDDIRVDERNLNNRLDVDRRIDLGLASTADRGLIRAMGSSCRIERLVQRPSSTSDSGAC